MESESHCLIEVIENLDFERAYTMASLDSSVDAGDGVAAGPEVRQVAAPRVYVPRRPRVDGDVKRMRRVRRKRCGLLVCHRRVAEAVLDCGVVDACCIGDRCIRSLG